MNEQNTKLSVIAYYISKFDVKAAIALGYKNRAAAINDISAKIGNGNNYLKLRRDEFDVLTESHRRGYANRKPSRGVLGMHEHLKDISFEDFTDIILQLLHRQTPIVNSEMQNNILEIDADLSNSEIEAIINAQDTTSTFLLRQSEHKVRIYNRSIIENLKKLYQYRCQICGCSTQEYGTSIVEAHHILSFSESQNNDSDNILILCPNHHRLIHRANPIFDKKKKIFIFPNGVELQITFNLHL